MQASIAKPRVPCHGQLPIHRQPRRLALHPFTVLLLVGLAGLLPPGAYPAAAAVNAKPRLKIPHVALAQVPWQRHFRHPTPLYIPLMSLPWADCHVLTLHLPHSPVKPWVDPDSHFIMAMCTDLQGNLWLATEGAGVYRYDPSAPQARRWTQFTKQNTHGTLANNCIYAIACDNRGRIWAGELNHGISVFNGRVWQDYDIVQNPKHHVLAGPLGNHVYAMAFDRYTDQMWIDTENGISIYQCGQSAPAVASRAIDPPGTAKLGDGAEPDTPVLQPPRHRWHYITQANGLPMNPDSMAFAPDGTVLVGTQCGGLTIGTPRQGNTSVPSDAWGWNHYRWETITGPWHMPLTATGNGLPGNLVNSVAVTRKNHLAVATDEGIALGKWVGVPQSAATAQSAIFSRGHRARASSAARTVSSLNIHLTFEHGQNFVAKVHGLWHPPVHWNPPPGQLLTKLPTEDHTTVVAWQSTPVAAGHPARQASPADSPSTDKAGYLWLGHWRTGLDVWQYDAQGNIIRRWHIGEPQVGNYVQSLLPLKGGAMAVGCYGKGIKIVTLPGQSRDAWKTGGGKKLIAAPSTVMPVAIPTEPQGARPPSARELTKYAPQLKHSVEKAPRIRFPWAAALRTDWATQGDWVARYGREYALLCSAHFDSSYHVITHNFISNREPQVFRIPDIGGPFHRHGRPGHRPGRVIQRLMIFWKYHRGQRLELKCGCICIRKWEYLHRPVPLAVRATMAIGVGHVERNAVEARRSNVNPQPKVGPLERGGIGFAMVVPK